ncbi:MAG: DNA repair exonuclease [Actinomycetota bacterium]|nr:DNA repair exonuclease [Actinomycetota bacterium]
MIDSVRFIHAADMHLGAPFKRVQAADPRVRDALLAASAGALDRIVDICIDRDVDFLAIAGDVFDSPSPHPAAQHAFRRAMERLQASDIPVYMTRGNHDPGDGHYDWVDLPDNVHIFSSDQVERVVHQRQDRATCAIHGWSFPAREVLENVAKQFERVAGDRIAVGILHANVGDREGWDPYAPCSIADLRAADMDYWALGHIHLPEIVSAESPVVVYSGSPQGLDPGESGARGCYLVQASRGHATPEFISTAPLRWENVAIDLREVFDTDGVRRAIISACERVRTDAQYPAIVRLELTGRTAVHRLLGASDLPALIEDVSGDQMERVPWVWIDRAVDRTRPAVDVDALSADPGFIGDLLRDAQELIDSGEADDFVKEALESLLSKVPTEAQPEIDADALILLARDAALDLLLQEVE